MKISIVTINWNNKEGLAKTIKSVLSQTYLNIEYIIIDGGSKDGSVDVINFYRYNFAFWISEPDKGIYHAMNKGLKIATGDYILFLNSGDYLHDDLVIEKLMDGAVNEDIIYGNLCTLKNGKSDVLKSAPEIHYYKKYQHNLPPHPAVLIKRHLINKLGGFDEEYKIIADVVMISKLFSNKDHSYKFLDIPVTVFDMNGVSSNPENEEKIYQERLRFIHSEFPEYLNDLKGIYKTKGSFNRIKERIKNFMNNL